MRLKLASRKSDLAKRQTYQVAEALKNLHANTQIEFCFRSSAGDLNLDVELSKMGDKGVFTQDFLLDLLDEKFEMVVHSWKDLPTDRPKETQIVATLPRADCRDLLLLPKSCWSNLQGAHTLKVLTSSPRRVYNLKDFLKWALPQKFETIDFASVRGNVHTRIEKLLRGDGDALIVAKAALDRLLSASEEDLVAGREKTRQFLDQCYWMVLPLSVNPNAAAQGALAVEVKQSREDVVQIVSAVNSLETFESVCREREILGAYGGGCHQKIGVSVLPRFYGQVLSLRGETEDGKVLQKWEITRPDGWDWPQAPKEKVFPIEPRESGWFDREELSTEIWQEPIAQAKHLWIARANALPPSIGPDFSKTLWVSGLKCWRNLAERGFWVNGSAESLGEREDPRLRDILGEEPQWTKLTHRDAEASAPDKHVVPTYALVEKPSNQLPNLEGKTHFYWMSGSSFRRALKSYPQLQESGFHACGPGNTYDELMGLLKGSARLEIFLSHSQWLEASLRC